MRAAASVSEVPSITHDGMAEVVQDHVREAGAVHGQRSPALRPSQQAWRAQANWGRAARYHPGGEGDGRGVREVNQGELFSIAAIDQAELDRKVERSIALLQTYEPPAPEAYFGAFATADGPA